MTCKNCGNNFEGKFCNNCGQKADMHRFTIKHALHDFFHTFTHVDSGLFFLIKELFLRPGIVAKEYIEGKRKKYFSPIQYLILAVAVATFFSVKYNLMGPVSGNVNPEVYNQLNEISKFFLQFNQFIYKYFNLILFVAVPVMALFSWLFYKKSGYNYAENVILNVFLAAQRTLILAYNYSHILYNMDYLHRLGLRAVFQPKTLESHLKIYSLNIDICTSYSGNVLGYILCILLSQIIYI
jgi:hypothetical protein